MKKLFALLLAFGMLAMLCACGSGTEGTNQSPAAAEQAEAQSKTDVDGLLKVVKGILGDAVSLDDYELVYMDEESVSLYLLDGERIELDYTIVLDDGTTIQLPMVYGELLDAGWTSSVQWNRAVEGNSMGTASHANANGDTIYVSIINPTERSMYLTDTWVFSVTLGGDYSAGFDVHGASEGSSIADVIAAWGKPYNISYYSGDNYTQLDFDYEAMDGTLSFRIDEKTGLVDSVTYHFASNYIE